MILNRKPLSMVEAKEYRKTPEEKKAVDEYLDKFIGKMTSEKAKKMSQDIVSLNNPKIRTEHIVKLIDFMPEDAEDVNKIFNDVSLSEEEANLILGAIRK